MNSGPVRSCWGAHTHSVSVKQQVIQYSSLDRVHVAFTVPRFCSIYHMVPHLTTLRYTHIRGNCSDYRTIGQCLVHIAVHHLSWWFLANPGNTIQFQWGSLVLANRYHIYTVLSVVFSFISCPVPARQCYEGCLIVAKPGHMVLANPG